MKKKAQMYARTHSGCNKVCLPGHKARGIEASDPGLTGGAENFGSIMCMCLTAFSRRVLRSQHWVLQLYRRLQSPKVTTRAQIQPSTAWGATSLMHLHPGYISTSSKQTQHVRCSPYTKQYNLDNNNHTLMTLNAAPNTADRECSQPVRTALRIGNQPDNQTSSFTCK